MLHLTTTLLAPALLLITSPLTGATSSLLSTTALQNDASVYAAPGSSNTTSPTSLLDEILTRGYLKVGTTGDYKPFSYFVSNTSALPNTTATPINTTYIGADIATAQALSNSLGLPHPVHYIPTTWTNLTADLLSGAFDIGMSGISVTLPRARHGLFSTPIQRVGKAACIRCADSTRFTSLADIDVADVTVAVNPGGTNEAFDRANLRAARIKVVGDNNAVYAAVMAGEADVMISDVVEVELQVRLHPGVLCMVNKGVEDTFTFEELGYWVPRDVVWKFYVDAFVRQSLGSGEWNRTLETWMGYQWPSV